MGITYVFAYILRDYRKRQNMRNLKKMPKCNILDSAIKFVDLIIKFMDLVIKLISILHG